MEVVGPKPLTYKIFGVQFRANELKPTEREFMKQISNELRYNVDGFSLAEIQKDIFLHNGEEIF